MDDDTLTRSHFLERAALSLSLQCIFRSKYRRETRLVLGRFQQSTLFTSFREMGKAHDAWPKFEQERRGGEEGEKKERIGKGG